MPLTLHRRLRSNPGSAGAVTTKQRQRQSPLEAYYELSFYTLSLVDPTFIHQYIVDAYAAQYPDESTKPITLAFALIGLYLHNEKHFSGREVQRAHIKLAKRKRVWPQFKYPAERGTITVFDVVKARPGRSRDRAINAWSRSVWEAWKELHTTVAALVQSELGD